MLTDRICLVTGAAQGMGRAIAIEAARQGAGFVALADINATAAEEAAAEVRDCGARALVIETDVSKSADVIAMIDRTVEAAGGLDCLFNIVGVTDDGVIPGHVRFEDLEERHWDKVMAINLKSMWLAMKHAAPHLRASKRGPSVVNAASVAGFVAYPWLWAYSASKAGVINLTQAAAIDFGKDGIRVNAFAPGAIATPMLMHSIDAAEDREDAIRTTSGSHLLRRLGAPEEVAKLACFLASDDASFITGSTYRIDAGTLSWRGVN